MRNQRVPNAIRRQTRITELRKFNGDDDKQYFALRTGRNSTTIFAKREGHKSALVLAEENTYKALFMSNVIPERRLFRRWVMTQFFAKARSDKGIYETIKNKPLKYMLRMLSDEFRSQSHMYRNEDEESLVERERFFNFETLEAITTELYNALKDLENDSSFQYYINHPKFSAMYNGAVRKVENLIAEMHSYGPEHRRERMFRWAARLQRCMPLFLKRLVKSSVSPTFVAEYVSAGAYFTLKNLILFHDFQFSSSEREFLVCPPEQGDLAILETMCEYHKDTFVVIAIAAAKKKSLPAMLKEERERNAA